MGFPRFLSDFQTGVRTFKKEEFPEHQDAITRIGVNWIRVKYRIEQGQSVINLLKETAPKVPRAITQCGIK
jgi:hypothetical protein